jgi:hypothetical protein
MEPDGRLHLVAEGAPPWPITVVPDGVMADAALLAAFPYVHRTSLNEKGDPKVAQYGFPKFVCLCDRHFAS